MKLSSENDRLGLASEMRTKNLFVVAAGILTLSTAVLLASKRMVTSTDLWILVGMYVPMALGVTVGYHRLLTHRAFQTYQPIKYLFAVLGSMAVQGPVLEWASEHRKHHMYSDREGDPHSPHVGHGRGWRGALRGLWHAHVGWVLHNQEAPPSIYSPDLLMDRGIVLIDRFVGVFVVLTFLIPFGLGLGFTGKIQGGLTALFWGGFVRVFLMHHFTFSVNSICHYVGTRRFDVMDRSGNVFWLSFISFGESWHNNHHAFPTSAFHGLRWWEFDVAGSVVRVMRALSIAWNVVEVPLEVQKRRMLKSNLK
jgi:stearoyl-CoA desaturase (delta-9 desaturase)